MTYSNYKTVSGKLKQMTLYVKKFAKSFIYQVYKIITFEKTIGLIFSFTNIS